jgi:NAD(P)H-dependent FMN reductase
MLTLGVVVASTREGRVGLPVADWFVKEAQAHGGFHVVLLDLKAINLPMLSEPNHPRLRRYEQDSTRRWSATVDPIDAFVIVTPEYNYSAPPALVNAIDHLSAEWHYKPVGLVSYGGISGGLRAAQTIKLLLTTMKMVPLFEAVVIPFVTRAIDTETGAFVAEDVQARAAATMLDELVRWTTALAVLRA